MCSVLHARHQFFSKPDNIIGVLHVKGCFARLERLKNGKIPLLPKSVQSGTSDVYFLQTTLIRSITSVSSKA